MLLPKVLYLWTLSRISRFEKGCGRGIKWKTSKRHRGVRRGEEIENDVCDHRTIKLKKKYYSRYLSCNRTLGMKRTFKTCYRCGLGMECSCKIV